MAKKLPCSFFGWYIHKLLDHVENPAPESEKLSLFSGQTKGLCPDSSKSSPTLSVNIQTDPESVSKYNQDTDAASLLMVSFAARVWDLLHGCPFNREFSSILNFHPGYAGITLIKSNLIRKTVACVPSEVMRGGGAYSFTAAYRRAAEMLWPQFWGTPMFFIFIYRLRIWITTNSCWVHYCTQTTHTPRGCTCLCVMLDTNTQTEDLSRWFWTCSGYHYD